MLTKRILAILMALLVALAPVLSMADGWDWTCPACGTKNSGNFCTECGAAKAAEKEGWVCPACGKRNEGNFCSECGQARPQEQITWTCAACGTENEGNFYVECGASKGTVTSEPVLSPYPLVTITMENGDTIRLELYPDIAPITVANFVLLARSGFYDGTIFHRVISGFMIQGGSPDGTGSGGPGYRIKGEFAANGVKNDLAHTRGVISMARARDYDSGGSQFFIMHADASYLDGQYAAFGRVIDDESLAAVDNIASVATDSSDRPLTEQRIAAVTVDMRGYDFESGNS